MATQAPVTVMRAGDDNCPVSSAMVKVKWSRAPGHPEAAPNFGGILPVHLNGAVRGSTPFRQSLRIGAIPGSTTVDDDTMIMDREFERQSVGMRMPREAIGADSGHVKQRDSRA